MLCNFFVQLDSCRLKKGKQLRKQADIKEVEKNIHLIRSPAGKSLVGDRYSTSYPVKQKILLYIHRNMKFNFISNTFTENISVKLNYGLMLFHHNSARSSAKLEKKMVQVVQEEDDEEMEEN